MLPALGMGHGIVQASVSIFGNSGWKDIKAQESFWAGGWRWVSLSVCALHPALSVGFRWLLPAEGRVSANRRACDPFLSHPENIRCKAQGI